MMILRRIKRLLKGQPFVNALDYYCTETPTPQAAVNIFKGEWASLLPGYESGAGELFNDFRINWGAEQFGGFDQKSVADLGPLEGGHSYMFQKGGAREVIAVEANARAYLKCLVTKELYHLDRVSFLHGDMLKYLEGCNRRFDLVNASGVLYHLSNPVHLIARLSQVTDAVLMWTHYYDEAGILANPPSRHRVSPPTTLSFEGYSYVAHRQTYGAATGVKGFCGGPQSYSYWMPRDEIIRAFKHYGFRDVRVQFDNGAGNGPNFNIAVFR